jgi:translation initiation factor IF-2
LQKEKIRVYILARELNMESKDLVDLCREHGLDVKNQLSSVDPEQRDQIVELVKRGNSTSAAAAAKPASPVLPQVMSPMRRLDARRPAETARPTSAPPAERAAETPPTAAYETPSAEPPTAAPLAPAARLDEPAPAPKAPAPAAPETPLAPAAELGRPRPPDADRGDRPPEVKPPSAGRGGDTSSKPPSIPSGPGRGSESGASGPGRILRRPRELRPSVVRAVPPPALKKLPPREPKKPDEPTHKPLVKFSPEMLVEAQKRTVRPEEMMRARPPGEVAPVVDDDEDGDKKDKKHRGEVIGRAKRQEERNARARARKGRTSDEADNTGNADLLIPEESPDKIRKLKRLKRQKGTQPRKGKVPIELPITVRALSEALGLKSVELLFKLRDHGLSPTLNINSHLDAEIAELLAVEAGCELEIKRPLDTEELLLAELQKPDSPEELLPRAPVVTIMGHVDHGKTSLLDKIRQTNVVATEAGGITQVIRAWRVEHGGRPITFLDTPGHEAFTKMRARGAQVTDIAVIVVAAEDGVMPQTEEAINHAKAAGVSLVVAINKVDLPNANVNRTRQQLYGLNVLPDNMGGDTPFVETSAVSGKGIDELLDQMSIVAELKELKANPDKPGRGTCLEAMLSEGEGVRATLLVQDGTLSRGDVILCGATYGRVRQLYDDQGRSIQRAGPSVPVRITGLDEVPNADDPFFVVPDLAVARGIADKRKAKHQETSLFKRAPVTLEKLTEAKIVELKIILKADFRGSIEAIRKEMEKLRHDEVRVRILEAAIGGITENDVWLALTSPQDTLIVGFNAVPDDRARALAEDKGIKILEYDIIYNLTNDIRAALEGKLKPREEVIHLGRAVVRQTFKVSRVGTIAGCYVTQGTIKRSAKIRLIREGVVIYPPTDRTAGLDSLKRFKEDSGEVREGFECGIKIAGYDDIKIGDVIEAFRVEQVQRTL